MKYKNNIDYNQKIRESIYMHNEKIEMQEKKLKRLRDLEYELKHIQEYSIKEIMPIFCKLILEIENKNFRWEKENFLIHNPNHRAYANLIDVICLINEESDFDKYSYNGKICRENSQQNGVENYWDLPHDDYVKIVYRNIEVQYYTYTSDGGCACYPYNSGMIDFSQNNEVSCYEWGPGERGYDIPFYSRIANPHFDYLLEFIRYCSYWRIQNEYTMSTMYKQIEGLIPSFVKEYKKNTKNMRKH